MDGASGFCKQSQYGSAKNLPSIIWPLGANKSGCKKTQKDRVQTGFKIGPVSSRNDHKFKSVARVAIRMEHIWILAALTVYI